MTQFTLVDATKVAVALLSLPNITKVELYGSIARGETGNDVDLLLITDNELLYQGFLYQLRLAYLRGTNDCFRETHEYRFGAFARIFSLGLKLPYEFTKLMKRLNTDFPNPKHEPVLDLFVLPATWRERRAELLDIGTHRGERVSLCGLPFEDQQIMDEVARDARVIAERGRWQEGYADGMNGCVPAVDTTPYLPGFLAGSMVRDVLKE